MAVAYTGAFSSLTIGVKKGRGKDLAFNALFLPDSGGGGKENKDVRAPVGSITALVGGAKPARRCVVFRRTCL